MKRKSPWNLKSREQKFLDNVEVRGKNECWPWKGSTNHLGYGVLSHRYTKVYAHRFALERVTGEQPNKLACHKTICTTQLCCNPAHLYWGTHQSNRNDFKVKYELCIRGHDLTNPANLINLTNPNRSNHRMCRLCQNIRYKEKHHGSLRNL